MKPFLALILLLIPGLAMAETVVAKRIIRPQTVISEADLKTLPDTSQGAFEKLANVVGQEARVALYPGRPIRFNDIGPPAIIERNQIVVLQYASSGLEIRTDGRSLARAGVGDQIRVMNLASKTTVTGLVTENGTVRVKP